MKKTVICLAQCAAFLFLPIFLFGQIVIDYNEVPHINGTRWTKNSAYEQTVSLGSGGGPQNWTFTSQPMGTDSCTDVVVPAASTPFHDSFPNTNLCYMSIDGSDSAFLYMRLVSSFISTLGIAGEDSSGGMFIKYSPVDTNNLPEHYNDNRHYRTGWRYDVDASTYMTYVKKGYETINAYGNVTIPYGTFPCLRYILFDTLIQTMFYNNVPVFCDTSARISHQFVAENRSGVVCVASHDGETNTYFTGAATLERLTYFYTGVEEHQTASIGGPVVTTSPNPFTGTITFTCCPRSDESGTLVIRDALGRVARVFHVGPSVAGLCTVTWNGTDDHGAKLPAGIYFYNLKTSGQTAIGKVILVK